MPPEGSASDAQTELHELQGIRHFGDTATPNPLTMSASSAKTTTTQHVTTDQYENPGSELAVSDLAVNEQESLMKFDDAHRMRLSSGITSFAAVHSLLVEERTRSLHTTLPWLIPCVGGRVTPSKSWHIKDLKDSSLLYSAQEVDARQVRKSLFGSQQSDIESVGSEAYDKAKAAEKLKFGSWREIAVAVTDKGGAGLFTIYRGRSFMKVSIPLLWTYSTSFQGARTHVVAEDGRLLGTMMAVPPSLWVLVTAPWKSLVLGLFLTGIYVFFHLVFPPLTAIPMTSFIEAGMITTAILVGLTFFFSLLSVWMAGYQKAIFSPEGKEIARLVKKPRWPYYIPFCGIALSRPYDTYVIDGSSCEFARSRFHQYKMIDSRRKLPRGMPAYQAVDVHMSKTGTGARPEVRAMILAAFMMKSFYPDYPLPLYHIGYVLPPGSCLCFA